MLRLGRLGLGASFTGSVPASGAILSGVPAPASPERGDIAFVTVRAMTVHSGELTYSTRGDADVIDITGDIQQVVADGPVADGLVTAFVRGSTAAITTMEFEPGGVADLRDLLDRLIPVEGDYEHNRLNHDTNSHAHQRASLIGASEQVPVTGGRLALGTWQQLVLIDFDDRPRDRTRGRAGRLLMRCAPTS